MNYRQFRSALRKTARTWYVDSFGRLRQMTDDDKHCPLTAVSGTPHCVVSWARASLKMGGLLSSWIAAAADERESSKRHIRRRRQRLMADCQPLRREQ
ncbi:hypothetical protein LCGC14_1915250 [marine sediment metagenome]|uniref:Uncharacterized protein n=1 Tax=marine sediment metagenome TaxID=412755 RepID=A0A0F9IQE3_9ZZZZ